MKNKKMGIYFIITLVFILCSIVVLSQTDIGNNIRLSKSIEIVLILYLLRVSYGCILFIKNQYKKQKYSYAIVMNLGLLIFISINVLRHIDLLIHNWDVMNIVDIYKNTLESFSYFAMLTLPCIIVLSVYSIITNLVLIKKEGFRITNLLGIILGILAVLGMFGSQIVYILTTKLVINGDQIVIKKFVDISINLILTYLYTLIIATLYCNIKASNHIPKYDKDFIIILGSKINQDGTLTPLLKNRVDKAISFGKNQYEKTNKGLIYVPSGGKGEDEIISEAVAIKNYLIKKGIDKENIVVEDKSINTIQNMQFSKNKIDQIKNDAKISFSTTNYHVFRSGVIANNLGIDCEGMGSKTKWYFYTNALIREFIANLYQERKKHLSIILIMIVAIFILIILGYNYDLIY